MSFYENNLEFVHTIFERFSVNNWIVQKIVEEDGLLYLNIEKDIDWLNINIETEIYIDLVDVLESMRENTLKSNAFNLLKERENEILCNTLNIMEN